MCQLTMIDVDNKLKISKAFIQSLIEINTLGIGAMANRDGFGYMLFSEPEKIVKTCDDAIKWFSDNKKDWREGRKDFNGIYHVRLASTVVNKTLYEVDAHPHKAGSIVLVHNGTLNFQSTEDDAKLIEEKFPKDCIDSEKLVVTINHFVGDGLLTAEHINKALAYFSGAYAIMVYDVKQPGKLFVIRGNDKKLHKLEITDITTGERVGLVINTGAWELAWWGRLVKHATQAFMNKNLSFIISEIPELKVFEYAIGSHTLGESICDAEKCETAVIQRQYTPVGRGDIARIGYQPVNSSPPATTIDKLVESCFTIGLTYKELCVLSEVIFDETFLTLEKRELEMLEGVLTSLAKCSFSGRKKEWEVLLKTLDATPTTAYMQRNILFPFFLNSKRQLKKEVSSVEKEKRILVVQ